MRKLIVLYILMIIFIAILAVLINTSCEAFSLVKFPHKLHVIIDGTNSLLMFLIFVVANHLYLKTKDGRLAILAGGFLVGGILNCVHIITVTSFPYDLLSIANLQKNPTLVYLLWCNLILPFSIYFAIMYKPLQQETHNFRFKIYSIYFFILLIATTLPSISYYSFPNIREALNIARYSLGFINYSLYIMLAFITVNIRQSSELKIFPLITIGLTVLGLGGLFYINPSLRQANELLAHIFQVTGLLFLLFGIRRFQIYATFLRFKDELAAYLCLVLVAFYIIFISITSALFNIIFPLFSAYLFIEFLLIFQFIIYLLTNKLTQPLTNTTEMISKYNPGEEPIPIPVIWHDEIGIFTEKINALTALSYQKILELSKIAEREHSTIRIFESMRRVSNQNVIKNSIIDELKKALNPDRIFIALYDSTNDSFYFDKYLESLPSKALFNFCKEEDGEYDEEKEEEVMLKKLNEFLKNNLELCFSNVNDYIVTNSLERTQKEVLLKKYKVKSCCNIPIYYAGKLLGCLVIQYTKEFKEFDNTDLSYIKMMATQLGVVMNQSGNTEG